MNVKNLKNISEYLLLKVIEDFNRNDFNSASHRLLIVVTEFDDDVDIIGFLSDRVSALSVKKIIDFALELKIEVNWVRTISIENRLKQDKIDRFKEEISKILIEYCTLLLKDGELENIFKSPTEIDETKLLGQIKNCNKKLHSIKNMMNSKIEAYLKDATRRRIVKLEEENLMLELEQKILEVEKLKFEKKLMGFQTLQIADEIRKGTDYQQISIMVEPHMSTI
jgi:hypothetical protein